jgi:hypothetical protein
MKKYNLILISFLFAFASYAQTQLTLTRGSRQKAFSAGTQLIFFTASVSFNGDSIESRYRAVIVSVKSDSINLRPLDVGESIFSKGKKKWHTHKTYEADTLARVVLAINRISKILEERENKILYVFSVAVVTELLLSPIYCFDSDGNFDFALFGIGAGVAVTVLAVTVPLAICFQYRSFKLKGNKNVWKIKA